jgi:hypothetical protein
MRSSCIITTTDVLTLFATPISAGPVAYGIGQVGNAGVVMACYATARYTWGVTLGATAPASIVACNSAFNGC